MIFKVLRQSKWINTLRVISRIKSVRFLTCIDKFMSYIHIYFLARIYSFLVAKNKIWYHWERMRWLLFVHMIIPFEETCYIPHVPRNKRRCRMWKSLRFRRKRKQVRFRQERWFSQCGNSIQMCRIKFVDFTWLSQNGIRTRGLDTSKITVLPI